MSTWMRHISILCLVLGAAACGNADSDEIADLRRQVEALSSEVAAPSPSPTRPTLLPSGLPTVDEAATADCPRLKELGFTRDSMLEYWYTHGRPPRLDGDADGIPCDLTFPGPAAPPVAAAPPIAEPAPQATQPAGALELLRFSNDIEYSDTCAHVILFFANRSDTAVSTATVHFHGTDANDRKIDLGTRLVRLGLAPFQENRYDVKVCDGRMGGRQFGPAAIPDKFTWEWFM